LRVVRLSLESPDAITASAISARDEIGSAIADRIRELETARDLKKVAEDVLPQIEKFLESPQQRRLRGIREGVVTSAVGLGATIFFFLIGLSQKDSIFLSGLGITVFFIGIGLIINALLFTVPKQRMPTHALDIHKGIPALPDRRELTTAEPLTPPPSVTEQTTHHLTDSPVAPTRIRESS
jgi:hypothetical protein